MPSRLKSAQTKLEKVLVQVEANKPKTAAGLTVVVAWGLPYFRNFIKPILSASAYSAVWPRESGGATDAVIDAIKFGSDPDSLILEDNEVMIMIRSDSPVVLDDVKSKLFNAGSVSYIGDIINVTSVRSGFVGRGFDKPSIAKQLAVKAGVAGAASIPDASQLMMGFTSTQKAALGPDNIASFETLGLTTVRPGDYFSGGAAMHLSHLYEDLALWYGEGYDERLSRMHSPRAAAGAGTVTLPNGPGQVSTRDDVLADAAKGPRWAQLLAPAGDPARRRQDRRLRQDPGQGHACARARGLQHPGSTVHDIGEPDPGSVERHAEPAGSALRGLRTRQRTLPRRSQRDGRRPTRWHDRGNPARKRDQRHALDNAPAELPRPAPHTPIVPHG